MSLTDGRTSIILYIFYNQAGKVFSLTAYYKARSFNEQKFFSIY